MRESSEISITFKWKNVDLWGKCLNISRIRLDHFCPVEQQGRIANSDNLSKSNYVVPSSL